jgi:hypothetical protein
MIGGLFNSLGIIPDVLRGKPFDKAVTDNLLAVPMAAAGANMMPSAMPNTGSYAAEAFGTPAGYGGVQAPMQMPSSGGGLLSGFKTAASYVQPVMQAAQAAQSVNGLFQKPQMQAPPMMQQNGMGAQTLGTVAQAGQQQIDQTMDADTKRRMMNQQIINQMMGRNYG